MRSRGPHQRRDSGDAFFPDPGEGPAVISDDLAEELAEEFLSSATTGQEQGEEGHEQFVDEEIGGPFVLSSSAREFGQDFDESNIPGAEREAYPTAGPIDQEPQADPTLDFPAPSSAKPPRSTRQSKA